MRSNKVLIFGLGHLASFLVKEFGSDAVLWGTYRSGRNGPAFSRVNRVRFDSVETIPEGLTQNWSVVIWNLPPFDGYKDVLAEFNSRISDTCPWIFVSSTSVYKAGDISEDSKRDGVARAGKLLIEIESLLKGFKRKVSIVRPGGLLDSIRNPANFFKGKTIIKGASTPVNLVHTQDVARFIHYLIKKELYPEDFNLVSDDHMSKEDFYCQIMNASGLLPPKWSDDESVRRVVSNQKSKSAGFNYLYPHLLKYFLSS